MHSTRELNYSLTPEGFILVNHNLPAPKNLNIAEFVFHKETDVDIKTRVKSAHRLSLATRGVGIYTLANSPEKIGPVNLKLMLQEASYAYAIYGDDFYLLTQEKELINTKKIPIATKELFVDFKKKLAIKNTICEREDIYNCVAILNINEPLITTIDEKSIQRDYKLSTQKYYMKHNNPTTHFILNLFEATNSTTCKYLAPDYVPTCHALYKRKVATVNNESIETIEWVGVASREIPNFESNKDNPLLIDETIIDLADICSNTVIQERQLLFKELLDLVTALKEHLYKKNAVDPNASYAKQSLLYLTKLVKDSYNTRIATQKTSVQLLGILEEFCNHKSENLTLLKVNELLKNINEREDHINKDIAPEYKVQYVAENYLISQIKEKIDELFSPSPKMIEQVDALIKMFLKNGTLPSNGEFIIAEVLGETIKMPWATFHKLRIHRGVGNSAATAHVEKDSDRHNQNDSKWGPMIDFDHGRDDLLYPFHCPSLYDKLLKRAPTLFTFIFSNTDVNNFLLLKKDTRFYWKTRSISGPSTAQEALTYISDNIYSSEAIENYKKLSTSPWVKFYQLMTYLQKILTEKNVWLAVHKLDLYPKTTCVDPKAEKELNQFDVYLNDTMKRQKEIYDKLIKNPQFEKYLKIYGPTALKLIKKNIATFKEECLSFLTDDQEKALQKELTAAFQHNLEYIDEIYQQLLTDIAEKKNISKKNPLDITAATLNTPVTFFNSANLTISTTAMNNLNPIKETIPPNPNP